MSKGVKAAVDENPIPIIDKKYYTGDCIACFENSVLLLYTPCGHQCICESCYEKQVGDKCPLHPSAI